MRVVIEALRFDKVDGGFHRRESDQQLVIDVLRADPVLRQNLVTIDIVDFLQPGATLSRPEGITILAVLLFQSLTQQSMQFGS
jgi:hypothetical protein